jgi:hypothetical protein
MRAKISAMILSLRSRKRTNKATAALTLPSNKKYNFFILLPPYSVSGLLKSLYCKTFYGRNLFCTVISQSVFNDLSLLSYSNIGKQGQKPI